ncbi:MAG: NAD(P)-dependent oxidoreductase [Proteobacteria bacterium]|nr:NAD(P)-dependent oxidoreductase [Pseudomonadota bacterium]
MLKHHFRSPTSASRVVIVGAGGFVGKAATNGLLAYGIQALGLARQDIDLLSDDAAKRLASKLHKTDTLVMIAAQAPVKNNAMLIDNLRMMSAVCTTPLTEMSCAQPASLHGVMHLAREVMLAETCQGAFCILRPTLVYGAGDPHNGYGPNRFRRLAQRGEDIVLFGDGEERRDHIYIDDVTEIIARCVLHKSEGVLNIATGCVTSFREIADKIATMTSTASAIRTTLRTGPMPHRGYRAFDATSTTMAFPDFRYTPLDMGLALSQNKEFPDGRN